MGSRNLSVPRPSVLQGLAIPPVLARIAIITSQVLAVLVSVG
jgi:hypothetical protein